MDADVLGHAVEGVEPPDRADVQCAVGVDVPHHQPDVVQVRRHGERVPLAAELRDQAALVGQTVGHAQLVEQGGCQGLHLLVLTGGAVRLEQALKGFQAIVLVKGSHGKLLLC